MKHLKLLIIAFLVLITGGISLYGQEYVIDFEGSGEVKTSYTAGVVTLSGRDWNLDNVLIGTADNDIKNGLRSARFRHDPDWHGTMTMLEDKSNGLGTISFYYARSNFSGDRQPTAPVFVVEYSLDQGNSWVQVGGDIDLDGVDQLTEFTETVNVDGDVRLRFRTISGTDGRRFNIDDIIMTDYGDDETVARPVFSPAGGSFFEPVTVSITTSTPGAAIYYTLDGEDPTEESILFVDPFVISETTTVKARAFLEGMNPSSVATANFVIVTTIDVESIADLRAGVDDGNLYRLTSEAILTFKQTFRNQKYIEDETAAVLIDDDTGIITTSYNIGDGITNLIGTVSEYGNMIQFLPTADPGPSSSTGNPIIPKVITAAQFDANYADYDAQLVTIRNVSFLDADGSTTFENGFVYPISDETATIDFRATFYNVDYIETLLPEETVDLTGLCNARTSEPVGFFISSRSSGDITEVVPPNTVATPVFSPPAGQFSEPINVTITTLTEEAEIFYTTDGSDPTENSYLYSEPLYLEESTTLKARAYKEGMNPSAIVTANYQIGYTRIKDIKDNISYYNGMTVTVQGVVTMGSGKIHANQLRAYIMDDPIIEPIQDNNRGIMLFDYDTNPDIQRGKKFLVTGVVGQYQGVTQLTDFTLEELESGIGIEPYVIDLSITQAQNYQEWEGTTVRVNGRLYENPYYAGGGYNVNIEDEGGRRLTVRVWDSTGIDVSRLVRGIPIKATGPIDIYNNQSQLVPGYPEDIVIDIAEPVIDDIYWEPENPYVGIPYVDDPITIYSVVFDYDGEIESVRLSYRLERQTELLDDMLEMEFIGDDTYRIDIPSLDTYTNQEDNYIVTIEATDNDGNVTTASRRIPVMKRRPIIYDISFSSPEPGDSLSVEATVTSASLEPDVEITEVRILYSLNYHTKRHEVMMEAISDERYRGYIPGQSEGTVVQIVIYAEDSADLFSEQEYDEDGEELIYTYPVSSHQAMLRIPPRPFNPWDGETISIGFFSEAGNKAIIRIFNAEGKLMFTPKNEILASQNGINYYNWNGRDRNNQILPIGLYICHLEVIDRDTGKKKTSNAPIVIGSPLN